MDVITTYAQGKMNFPEMMIELNQINIHDWKGIKNIV